MRLCSNNRTLALLCAIAFTACAGAAQPPAEPSADPTASPEDGPRGKLNSPTAGALVRELDAWDATVEIAQRTDPSVGLGDSVIRVEGEPVWPPAGEACLGLVRCCEQLAGQDPIFGMLCQMSIAKDGNCDRGLQTIATIVVEAERKLPEACVQSL